MSDDVHRASGRVISSVAVEDDVLRFEFTDGSSLKVWDAADLFCERRYLSCDDTLQHFGGASFRGLEVRDAETGDGDDGCHEVQFLVVSTSLGTFTVASHNEHNGYYGGFDISAEFSEAKPCDASDEKVAELARLYVGMTPQQIAAHEDWVRRYKAEKAEAADRAAEREMARRARLRAMTDEQVSEHLAREGMEPEAFLGDLAHAGYVRRTSRRVDGGAVAGSTPDIRFEVIGRRLGIVTAKVSLTLEALQAAAAETGLDVQSFRRLTVTYPEIDPEDATLLPAGSPGEAYLLPKVRAALLRGDRAFGIRAAMATAKRNGWRLLDAAGEPVASLPPAAAAGTAIELQTGAEYDECGEDGIDPDALVLVEVEYFKHEPGEAEGFYRLATFTGCPRGRRLAELCLDAARGA
ncbi:DUF7448 domain-containing protein [Methylobacterium platani]|uniref:DUF7448 domain-containing protein n=1 Tax=Methylobacterium platani TaxID=427683 RepID=A0A179S5Q8_9HYPH|nr:hypothetical protein [Methylobacterium platani]OAS22524.1 hypothetical protein A5481_19210 [Methylobacterium platani]